MNRNGKLTTFDALFEDFRRLSLVDLGKRAFRKIGADDLPTLSAAFAYNWVFSIPPLLILTVLVAALINRVTNVRVVEELREVINDRAPSDTRDLLLNITDEAVAQVGGGAASVGLILTALLALWAASSAVGILIIGFNRAYGVTEDRPFVPRKALTIGLTLLLVLFVNVAFALLVFGHKIGEWIADWIGLGTVFDTLWGIGRWPAAILGVMFVLSVLYWAGPNIQQSFRWITVGSAAATLLWLILVAGFGLYLNFADPGSAYGAVGSLIVLLVFLNFTGLIFFLGAEINAILAEVNVGRRVPVMKGPPMAVANR
jgi:membrane protein